MAPAEKKLSVYPLRNHPMECNIYLIKGERNILVDTGLGSSVERLMRHMDEELGVTEVIVTGDYTSSQRFLDEVDASCVLVNASTRFNDGQQLGLGAEIGIATTKLHSYGPMGLEDLTTTKFIVYGQGQIRE